MSVAELIEEALGYQQRGAKQEKSLVSVHRAIQLMQVLRALIS